jgi:hypothetical protein
MSNTDVTYLVGACCLVFGLAAFMSLVVVPAMGSYRRVWERGAVLVLSAYILAALIGVGAVAGIVIIAEWPRLF